MTSTAAGAVGFPDLESVDAVRDELFLSRATEAYRFFFPTVSGWAIWQGTLAVGVVPNRTFGTLDTLPRHVGLTLNSDTPYAPVFLDLSDGPMVVEVPTGPLVGAVLDLHQGWLADVGLPGPDAGHGGRHVVLPPGWQGEVPDDGFVIRSTSVRAIGGLRSIPVDGDLEAANDLLRRVDVHPLGGDTGSPTWLDLTPDPQDTTPNAWQGTGEFWRRLHEVLQAEVPRDGWGPHYGLLAELGITAGRPFEPDEHSAALLERAAVTADRQLRVEAFADRRPDRVVWRGTQWEWPSLVSANGLFEVDGHLDVGAREKWFYQAIAASPAMFRRGSGAGSVYWLGLRDAAGEYLTGDRHYTLTIPRPVPAQLFWSVTVYDALTRSQIDTDQGHAALRSLFELASADEEPLVLHFGPDAEPAQDGRSVTTLPGRGWFVYVRVYGPQAAAFDGGWSLPDIVDTTST